jgi:hypothetical protein
MSDPAKDPLLSKDQAPAPAKKVPVGVEYARKIHYMITFQFFFITGLVWCCFQSETIKEWLSNIWIVFTVLVLYLVIGGIALVGLYFTKRYAVLEWFTLTALTLSMVFFIAYLGQSANSPEAAYAVGLTMAIVNLAYSISMALTDERLTTECGIAVGIVTSLLMAGGLWYYNFAVDGKKEYVLCSIFTFVAILYAVYIFLNVKGFADGAKERISLEDYVIVGITVYLDFSLGLIIAIFREVCSQIAS